MYFTILAAAPRLAPLITVTLPLSGPVGAYEFIVARIATRGAADQHTMYSTCQ
jgi:hypothetical protein